LALVFSLDEIAAGYHRKGILPMDIQKLPLNGFGSQMMPLGRPMGIMAEIIGLAMFPFNHRLKIGTQIDEGYAVPFTGCLDNTVVVDIAVPRLFPRPIPSWDKYDEEIDVLLKTQLLDQFNVMTENDRRLTDKRRFSDLPVFLIEQYNGLFGSLEDAGEHL
jgi:hypothetical protein